MIFNQEGEVQMNTQTYGEKAVGLSFNPSNDSLVDSVKRQYARIIDHFHVLRCADGASDETRRLCSIAITEAQSAQMWAVKAITWRD